MLKLSPLEFLWVCVAVFARWQSWHPCDQWQVIVCLVCTSVYGRACDSLHVFLRAGSLSVLSCIPHPGFSMRSCLWCLLSACRHAHSFLSCIEISMTYKQWGTRQKRANSMGGRGYYSNFTALEAPVRLVNVTLKRNKQWLVVATDREICIWRVPQQRPCYYNLFLGNVCSLRILSHQKNK